MTTKLKDAVGPEDFGILAAEAEKARNYAAFLVAAERERLFGAMLSMPNLMHACDALGVPANGEYCDLLRRALYRA
jgi:hypothetical protein